MKYSMFSIALISAWFLPFTTKADFRNAIITWQGDFGYRARITITYDDSFSSVAAWGGGLPSLGGVPTNQGIAQLSFAFFSPTLQLLFATNDISGGQVTYRFLSINFDTTGQTLFGFFDVGKDSFAEGEPGSSSGQFYLTGLSFPALHDSNLAQTVDSGGQFTVTVVPEPSSCSLCLAGMGLLWLWTARSRALATR
jgi:hypothetical protein